MFTRDLFASRARCAYCVLVVCIIVLGCSGGNSKNTAQKPSNEKGQGGAHRQHKDHDKQPGDKQHESGKQTGHKDSAHDADPQKGEQTSTGDDAHGSDSHGPQNKDSRADAHPKTHSSSKDEHEKGEHGEATHQPTDDQHGGGHGDAHDEKRPSLAEALKGWKKPEFAFVVTGRQYGYIEPCGCQGLDNQKGGLARRFTMIRQLRSLGWHVLPIDAGNQVRRFGRQAEIKLMMTFESLRKMKYAAITFGPKDLRLPAGELAGIIANAEGDGDVISSNVTVFDESFVARFKQIKVNGKRLGITAVLGDKYQKDIRNDDLVLQPAEKALAAVSKKMTDAKCDFRVLISHATLKESRQFAAKFPFDLVISTGSFGEPDAPEVIGPNKTMLVQVGTKGMYSGVIAAYPSQQQSLRYLRMPLDARFADSKEMLRQMIRYQEQVKKVPIKPLPHPSGRQFVGSNRCGKCHKGAYQIWADGPHAHATESIAKPTERSEISRHHDPECLSCHVTGWDPQKYFPYVSGYFNYKRDKGLHGNGCENCHGPGKAHVEAEENRQTAAAQLATLRKSMIITIEKAKKGGCQQCHDTDNSPDFNWEDYWETIAH